MWMKLDFEVPAFPLGPWHSQLWVGASEAGKSHMSLTGFVPGTDIRFTFPSANHYATGSYLLKLLILLFLLSLGDHVRLTGR